MLPRWEREREGKVLFLLLLQIEKLRFKMSVWNKFLKLILNTHDLWNNMIPTASVDIKDAHTCILNTQRCAKCRLNRGEQATTRFKIFLAAFRDYCKNVSLDMQLDDTPYMKIYNKITSYTRQLIKQVITTHKVRFRNNRKWWRQRCNMKITFPGEC